MTVTAAASRGRPPFRLGRLPAVPGEGERAGIRTVGHLLAAFVVAGGSLAAGTARGQSAPALPSPLVAPGNGGVAGTGLGKSNPSASGTGNSVPGPPGQARGGSGGIGAGEGLGGDTSGSGSLGGQPAVRKPGSVDSSGNGGGASP